MKLSRRHFLKSATAVGALASMPLALPVGAKSAKSAESTIVNYKSFFNKALANDPRLIGFSDVNHDFSLKSMVIEGKLPEQLQGSLLRNGPAKLERGDIRYRHLFEGDGMIQQFRFIDGKVLHRGRFVQTQKYREEQKAQRFLYSGPDTKIDDSLSVVNNDTVNTANTNIIPVGDELWALWEAGSPTRIDKQTLGYKELVELGAGSRYGDKLKGLPFSAHPKIDSNGDIFNFGLHSSGHIAVYHLKANGLMKNVALINANYRGGMMHDFLITERHVLLVLPSLTQAPMTSGYFEKIQFDKNLPMRVLVLDKNTLSEIKSYELPPGFVFHFGNAWLEKDGTICFDASLYQDADVLHKLSKIMTGQEHQESRAKLVFVSLKTNGQVEINNADITSEFPRILPHLTGHNNQHLYHLSAKENALWSDSVSRVDVTTGKQESYNYGSDYLVEEHVPIAIKGGEKGAFVMGTALHVPSKRTCLNVFEADNLAAGPIARAWLPYHLPLGFHGNFVAS